jgi:drug/metabolite transporter (DMT)-like permease
MATWFFILTSLLWGSAFLLMKKADLLLNAMAIAGIRGLFGGLALLLLWPTTKKAWPSFKGYELALLAIVIPGYCWPYFIQPWFVSRHGGGLMGVFIGLVPLFTVIASIPLLKTKPTKRQTIGVLGGLFFLLLLSKDALFKLDIPITHLLLCASVPTCYAIVNIFIKKHFHHIHPMAFTAASLLYTAGVMLPLGATQPLKDGPVIGPVIAVITLGILCTGIANWMFYALVQQSGPLVAGMVTYVIPVIAIAWGAIDGERITLTQLICVAGILATVALAQTPPKKKDSLPLPATSHPPESTP